MIRPVSGMARAVQSRYDNGLDWFMDGNACRNNPDKRRGKMPRLRF